MIKSVWAATLAVSHSVVPRIMKKKNVLHHRLFTALVYFLVFHLTFARWSTYVSYRDLNARNTHKEVVYGSADLWQRWTNSAAAAAAAALLKSEGLAHMANAPLWPLKGPDGGNEIIPLDISWLRITSPASHWRHCSISTDAFHYICTLFIGLWRSQHMTHPPRHKETLGSWRILGWGSYCWIIFPFSKKKTWNNKNKKIQAKKKVCRFFILRKSDISLDLQHISFQRKTKNFQ